MTLFQFVTGVLLPPITVGILLLGLGYRIRRWLRAPVPKVTLYPSAKGRGEKLRIVAKEVLLFKSLWGGDRSLWVPAWVFHAALALIVVGHVRVATDFPRLWAALGMGQGDVNAMSAWVGGAVGLVSLTLGLFLLLRRFTSRAARDASKVEDYVALLLLLAVLATGDAMRFLTHFDLAESRAYLRGLVTLKLASFPQDPLFAVHLLFAQLLLIYLPFGKLLHAPGVFLSHPVLRAE